MKLFKTAIVLLLILTLSGLSSTAQTRKTRQTREEYIDRYKAIAIDHMERYGIPASITMAQGILESDCGNSWLSTQSNNHFGIKCKRNWTGGRIFYDDDEKGECFRSYPSVEDSYRDHAEFLDRQPRYDRLFTLPSDDYKGWAFGLKQCGYATAPDYAQRLIKIIEESRLYLLDRPDGGRLYASTLTKPDVNSWTEDQTAAATESTGIDPQNYRVTINAHKGYNVYQTNGVHYILAKEGDTFEKIGRTFRLSPKNLRKFNDITDRRAQPATGEVIYIARKKNRWTGSSEYHTCRPGETVYAVSQLYGIRSRAIRKMNHLKREFTLSEGEQLRIK